MSVALEGLGLVVAGQVVLHPITLDLPPGLPNVLLGPTGAGKTTLLRLLAGLDRPSEGRLLAGGRDVTGLDVRKRSVAMVYQQFINYPAFTVFENIASPLRVGAPGARRDRGAGARRRGAAAADALPGAQALGAVRRPTAAHRDRPRPGQAAPTWC